MIHTVRNFSAVSTSNLRKIVSSSLKLLTGLLDTTTEKHPLEYNFRHKSNASSRFLVSLFSIIQSIASEARSGYFRIETGFIPTKQLS
jgi:hypothetical protein